MQTSINLIFHILQKPPSIHYVALDINGPDLKPGSDVRGDGHFSTGHFKKIMSFFYSFDTKLLFALPNLKAEHGPFDDTALFIERALLRRRKLRFGDFLGLELEFSELLTGIGAVTVKIEVDTFAGGFEHFSLNPFSAGGGYRLPEYSSELRRDWERLSYSKPFRICPRRASSFRGTAQLSPVKEIQTLDSRALRFRAEKQLLQAVFCNSINHLTGDFLARASVCALFCHLAALSVFTFPAEKWQWQLRHTERAAAAAAAASYVRYTAEQVEALERVYAECPKPSSMRRQQLIRECPILANIEPKQIKVWFQNRRCREKQRKEAARLQTVNRKLTAMNKLLMEENDRLQKQVSQLVYENGYMRQQLQNASVATTDTSCESVVTTPQHPIKDTSNPAGLLSIAEETLAEFLAKATGTAVDWVQMPGMKPGPDSVGIVAISHRCSGVAARACGLVSLEPTKIAEILKDRPSWFRDCRNLEVFTMFPAGNGGTIELLYMQMYAPTTLAPPRDLWTLRYTTTLDDGSLVVCERSLSGSGAALNGSTASQSVRAEMLPSGYLIRPCEGGGSIIHIVDHLNLEAWSVPEVLRPLYESSKVIAQKMTIAALRHIRQIAQEMSGEAVYGLGRQPAVLRTFSQRLSRGFNNAINGFNDDGWSVLDSDGVEDVVLAVNSTKNISTHVTTANPLSLPEGILCAKASMLLQRALPGATVRPTTPCTLGGVGEMTLICNNVPPALLVRFLREHRSEWADYNIDAYSAASLKAASNAFPGLRPTRFSGSQIIMPLANTVENEEFLEVVRLEGQPVAQEDAVLSRDVHLLQLCSGADENAVGAFSELIFAPIDELFPDDAPLLPSGFRVEQQDGLSTHRTLDLASSLEAGSALNRTSGDTSMNTSNLRSVLTIAFQFPYEVHLQDSVATMARQYLRSVIASVQRVALAISPSRLGSHIGPKTPLGSPEALTLSRWICQSYSPPDYETLLHYHLGVDLLRPDSPSSIMANVPSSSYEYDLKEKDPVLCLATLRQQFNRSYSRQDLYKLARAIFPRICEPDLVRYLISPPFFTFANQAGLDMLETTLLALQDIQLDKIFDESGQKVLCSEFAKIMQQGYTYLPVGLCLSTMGRHASYDQAIAWKVIGEDNAVYCLAFVFVNWSFV
ncbi:Homeobox-leucine zipper protein hox9 [Asimina triloba]